MQKFFTLKELADFLGAALNGDADCKISSIAPLDQAKTGQIGFLERTKYRKYLATTNASAVILTAKDLSGYKGNAIVVKNSYIAYAKLSSLFADVPLQSPGIDKSAVIGCGCHIAESVCIGANCVIGNNVTIGVNSVIAPGCVIGDSVIIGEKCFFFANVTIYYRVIIGSNVILHSGVVIGSDGFGMANENGKWIKIYQLGSVEIGNDVEIGANTCIDRGALENTIIGNGVKLDNLIQIAHNVKIGDNTVVAGCTGIAGSTKIGKNCMIGGAANISGHLEITDGVIVSGGGAVARSLEEPGIYTAGIHVIKHRDWMKLISKLYQLPELADRIRKLEEEQQNDE